MASRSRRRSEPAALRLGRGTHALGALAVAATVATAAVELARVWRRGSAPVPHHASEVLTAGRAATEETLAVLREGYRASPDRENAVFNMLVAYAVTFGGARGVTALIRSGRGAGILANVVIADRHIHHFVPGMVLGLAAGGTAIAARGKELDRWLAIPFGAGTALVLDEAALLLELEDVYWSEEGVLSVQVSFAALAVLAALALAVRVLQRGEARVLVAGPADGAAAGRPALR